MAGASGRGYDRRMLSILDLAIIQVLRSVEPEDQPAILARTVATAGSPDASAAVRARIDELRRYVVATTPRTGPGVA